MATYDDPYEAWKAAGRPGSFSSWQAQQAGQGADRGGFTSPPQSAPQYIQSQPQPSAPQATQGPGRPWSGQGAPPPSTVPGLEQSFATQRGNTDWRDTNVSQAQWGAWEQEERERAARGESAMQNTPGGCPPDKPFTSRVGSSGQRECAFKPDDCPEGEVVVGSDTNGTAKCVKQSQAGQQQGPSTPTTQPAQPQTPLPSSALTPQTQEDLWKPPAQKMAGIMQVARNQQLGPHRLWKDMYGKQALANKATGTTAGTSPADQTSSKMLL